MAISVDYGSISGALGLAQKAGQNQGDQTRFKNFMDFANLTQQAQAELDRRNSMQIQNSLQQQGIQERYATTEDQINAQNQHASAQMALANRQMANTNAYRQGSLDVRQQQQEATADYRDTRASQFQQQLDRLQGNDDTKQQAISQLPPDQQAAVQATGRLPYGTQTQGQEDDRRSNVLLRQLEFAQRQLKTAAFDPTDLNRLGSQESQKVPGAVAGKEATFQQASSMVSSAQQELAAIASRRQQPQSPMQAGTQGLDAGQAVKTAAGPGAQGQAAQPPATGPGSKSMPVHITDAQDYAQLPPGSYFIDPQGQLRQKA